MPKVHHITTDDAAVVQVTSGTEYGAREVIDVTTLQANRQELLKQAAAALDTIQGHINDIDTQLAAWAGFNSTQVKDSLGNEIIPALRFALVAEKKLARVVANQLGAVD